MRTALFSAAILAAFVALPTGASAQYGSAPWCAVVSIGSGGVYWDCEYASAAECAPNVIAGNRGFCNLNPYAAGRGVEDERRGCHIARRHVLRHGRRVVITRRVCR